MKVLGSPPHSFSWFEYLKKYYKDDMQIVIIKFNKQPVAAGVLLRANDHCSVPWASSLRKYNYLNANMLLYWQLLRLAIKNQCSQFDFGRSSYGENTYKFKKQWGAKPLLLKWNSMFLANNQEQPNNIQINKFVLLRPLIAKAWSFLPLPFTVFIGSKIRKFISL